MSIAFKPKHVPSDIVSRWPAMAMTLWKRSFKQQACILLTAALLTKIFPAAAAIAGFLIAPSLFIVSFTAVRIADEQTTFSWLALCEMATPSALRLGYMSVQFAAMFGAGIAALFSLASLLPVDRSAMEQPTMPEDAIAPPAGIGDAMMHSSQNSFMEFIHFCATWTEGVMALVFLGLFIVAIYHGIFGAILYGQEGMNTGIARNYGWQAWQINSESIEQALREAPPKFFVYLAAAALAIICGFQTVYLSPAGLILATYVPCLAYVAYRSIFFGKHENVAATNRATSLPAHGLAPAGRSYASSLVYRLSS
jgi:hypothetical protein